MVARVPPRPVLVGLAALLLAVLVALVWLGAGRAEAAHGGLAQARARGHLVVGVPLWLPPFGAPVRAGGWAGLDVALARAVATVALGDPERVQLLPLSPTERVWAIRSGAADVVIAAYAAAGTPVPPPGITLVGPYYSDPLALLVRRGAPVRRWQDLDGRLVGVVAGSPGRAALLAATGPQATPVLVEPVAPALLARELGLGQLRAAVCGLAICRALATYDPALAVQRQAALGQESYYALVPDGDEALAAAVRRGIAALPQGRALAAALTAWSSGPEAPPLPAPDVLPAAPAF